jgi:hypothetical protein
MELPKSMTRNKEEDYTLMNDPDKLNHTLFEEKEILKQDETMSAASKSTTTNHTTTKRAIPLSKNMEYILKQAALAKGLDPSLLKSNEFSHLIVKGAGDDEFMYLSVMVRRLNLCCPYHPSHDADVPQQETVAASKTHSHHNSPLIKDKHIQSKQ